MPMDKNFVHSFYLNTGVMPNNYSVSIMSENKVLEYVTHGSTVAHTVMCRQDGRGRFPVLLDDLSKCRINSHKKIPT